MSQGQHRAGSNLQSLNRVQQQIVAKAIHPTHGVDNQPSCIGLQTYAAALDEVADISREALAGYQMQVSTTGGTSGLAAARSLIMLPMCVTHDLYSACRMQTDWQSALYTSACTAHVSVRY